jgi:ribonucleoside-diphosphate reductase alpha chain
VFIRIAKEGSTIGGLMDTIATLVSVSLQYGVPVESLVRKFEHVRFEPSGMTRNPDIPIAKSLVDYIFRYLAMEFVPGYRAAHAPQRPASRQRRGPKHACPRARQRARDAAPRRRPPATRVAPNTPTTSLPTPSRSTTAPASPTPADKGAAPASARLAPAADPLSQQGTQMQSDAPGVRGLRFDHRAQRHLLQCQNCGNSMGCS